MLYAKQRLIIRLGHWERATINASYLCTGTTGNDVAKFDI